MKMTVFRAAAPCSLADVSEHVIREMRSSETAQYLPYYTVLISGRQPSYFVPFIEWIS
jgi:hypothetical protein